MIRRWFNRPVAVIPDVSMQSLETRRLCADGPRIDAFFADNRGYAEMLFDKKVLKTTLNKGSVDLLTAGDDGDFNTDDDVEESIQLSRTQKKLIIIADLDPNTEYLVRLDSSTIKGTNGEFLDGEFRGSDRRSGNGNAGGDFEFVTAERSAPRAILPTDFGWIEIRLFEDDAPESVENFVHYLDNGAWDASFVNRSLEDFVLQMGGFGISENNTRFRVEKTNPSPTNEPGISNTRGTVAWAKRAGKPNSASNEYFFNLDDNGGTAPNGLDFQNGGFTVFGKVTDASLAVLNRIEKLVTVNEIAGLDGPFADVPIKDTDKLIERGGFIDPLEDLVKLNRAGLLMNAEEAPEPAGFKPNAAAFQAARTIESSGASSKADDEEDLVSL